MMDWLMEHWSVVTTLAGLVTAALTYLGKARYARVVSALVLAIEQEGGRSTKTVAKQQAAREGVSSTLAKLVKKLTEGE